MADAANTVDKQPAKKNGKKAGADLPSPQGAAREQWAREAKTSNPVTESYYELLDGHKLLMCKRRESGSVHRTLIGSTKNKHTGASVKSKIEELQKANKLRIRMTEFSSVDVPSAPNHNED